MTKQQTHLVEAATLVGESAREDGSWKVRLISEGQGSSGFYTRKALEETHSVFNDVLSFKNHPSGWDGPETRDFTMIVGEIVGDVWVEDDERGMAAIYGWYLPDPEHKDKIERYKKKIALSIFAMGDGELNEDTGRYEVLGFVEDPYTSLDVVLAPGARGGFMEAARQVYAKRVENASASPAGVKSSKKGFSEMEIKELGDLLGGKIDALTAALTSSTEAAAAEAQANVDEAAVESAVQDALASFADKVKSIESAELLPTQVASLMERAKLGKDIEQHLTDAVAIAKEARSEAGSRQAESGRFGESASGTDYKLSGFGERK